MTACLSFFYFTFVSLFHYEFLSIANVHAGNMCVSNTASLQVVCLSVIGFLMGHRTKRINGNETK